MRAHRRWAVAVVAATGLLGLGLTPAGAHSKLDSFSGSCSVQGTAYFTPPATTTQQMLAVRYDASGTCSGTLNRRSVSSAPVRMHHTARSEGSCLRARTTAPGQGAITFADGTTIRYTIEFSSVLTEVEFAFYGKRSGSAAGHGTFLTERTPPDIGLQCAGEGAAEVPLDISLTTDSPLVSEHGRRDRDATRVRHR